METGYLYRRQTRSRLQWHLKWDQLPHQNQPPPCLDPPHHFHRSCINWYSLWWFSLVMMEYLQLSGLKCLDFQSNNKKNRKSKTYVAYLNCPLPMADDPPPPPLWNISSKYQQLIVYRLHWLSLPPRPVKMFTTTVSNVLEWWVAETTNEVGTLSTFGI